MYNKGKKGRETKKALAKMGNTSERKSCSALEASHAKAVVISVSMVVYPGKLENTTKAPLMMY